LVAYFEARQRARLDEIEEALRTMRPYERRLVREAAVMGYVRGSMSGRTRANLGKPREGDIPRDGEILTDVLGACISMPDVYPFVAAAAYGKRRRVVKKWPGEAPDA
jgi:hypothetical protein